MKPLPSSGSGLGRRRGALVAHLCVAALTATLFGCATSHEAPDEFFEHETSAEESAPLGGEALAQRRRELNRAHGDLAHFHDTLSSLRHRRNRSGSILFSGFLDAWMGRHLNPLLRHQWQSRHPEVMGLDANLRIAKALVLIQLRDPGRAQDVIEELKQRFEGRESMLVEYPLGGQSTLADAIEQMRKRKWRG